MLRLEKSRLAQCIPRSFHAITRYVSVKGLPGFTGEKEVNRNGITIPMITKEINFFMVISLSESLTGIVKIGINQK
jgi:hypothetical protein